MIDINQVTESVISGCAISCGAFLAVAGASKLYRSVRALDDMTAIRRALRMPRRQWRLFGLTAGGVECVTGLLVCGGAYPLLGGAGLAGLGAGFCVLLAYVLVKQTPGGCGCIRWRTAPETAADAVTWRAVARGGTLLGAGIAYTLVGADAANAPRHPPSSGKTGSRTRAATQLMSTSIWAARDLHQPTTASTSNRGLSRHLGDRY